MTYMNVPQRQFNCWWDAKSKGSVGSPRNVCPKPPKRSEPDAPLSPLNPLSSAIWFEEVVKLGEVMRLEPNIGLMP